MALLKSRRVLLQLWDEEVLSDADDLSWVDEHSAAEAGESEDEFCADMDIDEKVLSDEWDKDDEEEPDSDFVVRLAVITARLDGETKCWEFQRVVCDEGYPHVIFNDWYKTHGWRNELYAVAREVAYQLGNPDVVPDMRIYFTSKKYIDAREDATVIGGTVESFDHAFIDSLTNKHDEAAAFFASVKKAKDSDVGSLFQCFGRPSEELRYLNLIVVLGSDELPSALTIDWKGARYGTVDPFTSLSDLYTKSGFARFPARETDYSLRTGFCLSHHTPLVAFPECVVRM